MDDIRCIHCGRRGLEHIMRRCPQGLSVTLDAATLDRLDRTGHPRLLGMLLSGNKPSDGKFSGIEIESVRVS